MLYRCSQTCLVGCIFFYLLKFVLLKDQRAEENRKSNTTTDSEKARKSFVHEFFFTRVRDLAYIGRDRICCCNGGEHYYNDCFYEEQLSSQKKLVLGY